MKFRISERGLTFSEVLIAIVLMGLMFSMIVAIVVLLKNNYNSENERALMQQSAAVIFSKLSKELMEASADTVTIYNPTSSSPPAGIIFASAREPSLNNDFDLNTSGDCIWHKYVCYYLDTDPESPGEKALFRKEKEVTETTLDSPSPDSTETFKNDTGLTSTIIAHGVDGLNFPDLTGVSSGPSEIAPNLPLQITVSISNNSSDPDKRNSLTLTFTVNMHN